MGMAVIAIGFTPSNQAEKVEVDVADFTSSTQRTKSGTRCWYRWTYTVKTVDKKRY